MDISEQEFKEICDLTLELTKLRQNECKHLSIENIAPEILHALMTRLVMIKQGQMFYAGDGNIQWGK